MSKKRSSPDNKNQLLEDFEDSLKDATLPGQQEFDEYKFVYESNPFLGSFVLIPSPDDIQPEKFSGEDKTPKEIFETYEKEWIFDFEQYFEFEVMEPYFTYKKAILGEEAPVSGVVDLTKDDSTVDVSMRSPSDAQDQDSPPGMDDFIPLVRKEQQEPSELGNIDYTTAASPESIEFLFGQDTQSTDEIYAIAAKISNLTREKGLVKTKKTDLNRTFIDGETKFTFKGSHKINPEASGINHMLFQNESDLAIFKKTREAAKTEFLKRYNNLKKPVIPRYFESYKNDRNVDVKHPHFRITPKGSEERNFFARYFLNTKDVEEFKDGKLIPQQQGQRASSDTKKTKKTKSSRSSSAGVPKASKSSSSSSAGVPQVSKSSSSSSAGVQQTTPLSRDQVKADAEEIFNINSDQFDTIEKELYSEFSFYHQPYTLEMIESVLDRVFEYFTKDYANVAKSNVENVANLILQAMQSEEYQPIGRNEKIEVDPSLLLVEDEDWFRVNTWGFRKPVSADDEVRKAWVPIFQKFRFFEVENDTNTYMPEFIRKKFDGKLVTFLKGSTRGFRFVNQDNEYTYFEIDIQYGIPFLKRKADEKLFFAVNKNPEPQEDYKVTRKIRERRYNDFIDETIEKYDLLIGEDADGLDFNFGDEDYFLVATISDKKQIIAEDEGGKKKIFTVRTSNLEEIEFVPVSQEEGVSATNQSKALESAETSGSFDSFG